MFKWSNILHIGNNPNKYYKNVNWQITRVIKQKLSCFAVNGNDVIDTSY